MAKLRSVEEFDLVNWIERVRRSYRNGSLSPEKIEIMESLPNWSWKPNKKDAAWQEGFSITKKYGVVPPKFETPEGYSLGSWQSVNRCNYKKNALSEERIKLLESIPGWEWDIYDSAWKIAYELTKKHGLVKKDFVTKDGYYLGQWQINQRSAYANDKMPAVRIKLLESIPGWVWKQKNADRWDTHFECAKKYGVVSYTFITPEGYPLGIWQHKQKTMYRKGSMPKERIEKLQSISGWKWK